MYRWAILLFLVIILALGLRLFRLNEIPAGYTWDEASQIYSAWSISLWYRDEFAQFMPLTFRSFGDYKPPLLVYLLAGIYRLSGLHEVAIRIISALAGVGVVIVSYYLSLWFLPNNKLFALLGSFLTAVIPWTFHFSRIGFEQQTAFFFIVLGVWGILSGLALPRNRLLILIGFGLAPYAFHTAKVFIPVIAIAFSVIFMKQIKQQQKAWFFLLATLLLMWIPLLYASITSPANTRANTLIFFHESGGWIGYVGFLKRIVHNAYAYVDPTFWVKGNDVVSRNSMQGYGVTYWTLIPFFIIGIVQSLRLHRQKDYFLISWLYAGLLPSLITWPAPHALRSLFAAVPVILLTLSGVYFFYAFMKKRFQFLIVPATLLMIVLFLAESGRYFLTYFQTYSTSSAYHFQYGYSEAFALLDTHSSGHEKRIVTDYYGQPYIYALLHYNIHPQAFLFGALSQYEFRPISWPEVAQDRIYMASPKEISPSDPAVIDKVFYPNSNEVVWVIAKT